MSLSSRALAGFPDRCIDLMDACLAGGYGRASVQAKEIIRMYQKFPSFSTIIWKVEIREASRCCVMASAASSQS